MGTVRATAIGTAIGILPGVGATTAAFIGYSEAVRWSKHPEKFGTGVPEGIAGPETANNAATGGAMVPLLTLGIPGSATTAVIIGGFLAVLVYAAAAALYRRAPRPERVAAEKAYEPGVNSSSIAGRSGGAFPR